MIGAQIKALAFVLALDIGCLSLWSIWYTAASLPWACWDKWCGEIDHPWERGWVHRDHASESGTLFQNGGTDEAVTEMQVLNHQIDLKVVIKLAAMSAATAVAKGSLCFNAC